MDAIQWRHKTEHEESKANAEVPVQRTALIFKQLADHDHVLTLVDRFVFTSALICHETPLEGVALKHLPEFSCS